MSSKLSAVLASKFAAVAIIPVGFGVIQAVDCRRVAATPAEIQGCWKTGLAIAGIGGAGLAGYNIPNPKLDKARHELAVELDKPTERAAAAPPPPLPEDPAPEPAWKQDVREMAAFGLVSEEEAAELGVALPAPEVLPPGWERDVHGRLHDEEGRYVGESR